MVVLDVMLPGKSGFEVAAELRQAGQFVPFLMLTARDQPQDVLRGFESGADDYLTKPFELAILIARLRSLFRRYEWLRREQCRQSGASDRSNASAESTRNCSKTFPLPARRSTSPGWSCVPAREPSGLR